MKLFHVGDRKCAICHRGGRVTVTFAHRDLPFRDGAGVAGNVLVGVCEECGDAILVPAQSTPVVAEARRRCEHPEEGKLEFAYAVHVSRFDVGARPTPKCSRGQAVFLQQFVDHSVCVIAHGVHRRLKSPNRPKQKIDVLYREGGAIQHPRGKRHSVFGLFTDFSLPISPLSRRGTCKP